MRIVLLKNKSEATDYEKNHHEENDFILPIGPSARHHAISKGWEIRTLGSLWEKDDYLEAKQDSDRRIKTLVNELNDYSKSLAKNFPLEIGNYFHNNLLLVIGTVLYNYFILKSILKKTNPSCWLKYNSRYERWGSLLYKRN